MMKLPNRKSTSVIEAVKKPPIDIIRREPSIATDYSDVIYTREPTSGDPNASRAKDFHTRSPGALRASPSMPGRIKSVVIFLQGMMVGIVIVTITLLVNRGAWEPLATGPNERPVREAVVTPSENDSVTAHGNDPAHPSDTPLFEAKLRKEQADQELLEAQALNHLLTAQVEDLRAKLVRTKSDLSTMTSTKDYYVEKAQEVEAALLEQKRKSWVAEKALGRALDKINP